MSPEVGEHISFAWLVYILEYILKRAPTGLGLTAGVRRRNQGCTFT
jgi:hypothetical protein